MASLSGTFGIAAQNFTVYPDMPDVKALVDYGVTMEQLGFELDLGMGSHSARSGA